MAESISEIVKRGSIYIPPDNRRCSIKRIKTDGTYDAEWLDVSKYVTGWATINTGFPDDIFVGEYNDTDVEMTFDNSQKTFNDEKDSSSMFYNYRSRYKTLFKIEVYAVDADDNDVLLRAWYGISFSNPSTNDLSDMSFTVAPTTKILQNYTASGIDLSSGTTETLINRLLNKTKDGVSLFDIYFTGFKINDDADSVMTISNPYIEEKQTVLDKLQEYSFYDDFFYYVDNDGYLVWKKRDATASVQWEFSGTGNVDSTYPVNIQSIDSYYNDIDNTYTKVAIGYAENSILEQNVFSGIGYDDGTATYLSDANSNTIYAQMVTDGYIGTNSRLTQDYVADRDTLDAYLLANWSNYQGNIIDKLSQTVKKDTGEVTAETTWSIGDNSVADIYGDKVFSKEYKELTSTEAGTVANRVLTNYKDNKDIVESKVVGAFHLYPTDRIKVNYRGEINVQNPFIIGVSLLGGTDVLAGRTGSINLDQFLMKIVNISINLDNFDISMKWRQI